MSAGSIGRDAATESVAERFTRLMRATISPYGALTDPPLVFLAVALVVVPSVILIQTNVLPSDVATFIYAAAALPIVVAIIVSIALLGAREQVIAWIAALPFPFENMNALLNGVATTLLVRFNGETPTREAINELLETVHDDCFALEFHHTEPEVELRIGIPDSKVNPSGAHHRRFLRVKAMVEIALVPISRDYPIASVRVC